MKKILIILILISINLYSLTQNEENFLEAAEYGNINKIKELLTLGIDVNIQNEDGYTALIWASYKGYIKIVRALIKAGANVNIQDENGKTALTYASNNGDIEIIRELIAAGSDINIKDNEGNK